MDTTYEDVTDQYIRAGHGVQQPSPLIVCELQSAHRGTFCFPMGAGFGCGLELKLNAGAETTLNTRFMVGTFGVIATLVFKVGVEVAYKSHRCEYCRPKVCVEAMLFAWKCERFLGFWSWTTIDTQFVPSVQPLFLTNCTPNDPLCNCAQRTAMLHIGEGDSRARFALREDEGGGEAQARGLGEMTSASTLVSPATFAPAVGGKSLPPEAVAELASQHVEGLLTAKANGRVAVLRDGQRVSWLTGAAADAPPEITLLSRGAWDVDRLRVSEALPRLPILAVAPCVPGARADVRVTAERTPERPEEVFSGPAYVGTDRATTIWADVDLSDAALPAGTKGHVTVTLRDESKRTVSTLIEPFVVTHTWKAGEPHGHTG